MSKFLNGYEKFENAFTAVTLFVGISMIVYGVAMRYIFRNPQAWVDELSVIVLAYGVTLGYSLVTRKEEQIVMDAIDMILKKPSKALSVINNLFSLIFSVLFGYFGYLATIQQYKSGRVSPLLLIPREYVYVIIPITGALLAIQYTVRLMRLTTGFKEEPAEMQVNDSAKLSQ